MTRRPRAEVDREIVKKAGPWRYEHAHSDWGYVASVRSDKDSMGEDAARMVSQAAARLLNAAEKGKR
jgi:hypothetical protein